MIQCFDDDDEGKQYKALVTGKATAAHASPRFLARHIIHRARVGWGGRHSGTDAGYSSSSCAA